MLARIARRGRPYEQLSADPGLLNYYKDLNAHYEPWYRQYNASSKMIIDGDRYDFVNNKDDRRTVLHMIDQRLCELGKLDKETYDRLCKDQDA